MKNHEVSNRVHFRGGLGRPGRATRAAKLVEALISANRERNENLVKHINRLNFVLSLGVQLCARRLLCRLPARPCLGSFNSIMTFSIILYDEKRQKLQFSYPNIFLFFIF